MICCSCQIELTDNNRYKSINHKCKDCCKTYNNTYRRNNKEILEKKAKIWIKNNREKVKETEREYRLKNPHKNKAKKAKRRAAKLQQTPKWADLKAIEEFYKNCPEGYTIDHIIPLRGKNVRGLHILENLQYLTKSENSSKGNRI